MGNDPEHADHAAPELASPDPRIQAILDGPDVVLTQPSNTTKFNIMAALAVIVPGLAGVFQSSHDPGTFVQGLGGLIGVGAVYLAGYNATWWKSPKMYALMLAAGLNALAPFLFNGWHEGTWSLTYQQGGLAVLAVIGAAIAVVVPATHGQDQTAVKAQIEAHGSLYPQD